MSETPNNPGVWPGLLYTDSDAARTFLIEVFGFTDALTVRDDDNRTIVHAELRWPEGGGVMFGTCDSTHEGELPQPSGLSWLYVVTADPDAVYHRAVSAGAKVVQEPYDADYGSHNVGVADTEGNIWTFGTYNGA